VGHFHQGELDVVDVQGLARPLVEILEQPSRSAALSPSTWNTSPRRAMLTFSAVSI
jgi:hypothetical protein